MATTSGDPPEPPWLDTEEREAWHLLVGIMVRLDAALDAQLRRDAGISHFEYAVLGGLARAPGQTMRLSELAALTEGSLSRLSQVVTRLANRGLVRRMPDPDDGRYTLAILTEDGLDKVVTAAPGHMREVRRLVFDPLTNSQVRQLARIGRRLMHTINPKTEQFREAGWFRDMQDCPEADGNRLPRPTDPDSG